MTAAWIVFRKELADALRDRRTWLVVLISSAVAGPILLLVLSRFVSSIEESSAKREVYFESAASAPTLVNFIQRAGGTVRDAPADFRAQIKSGRLANAVLVVPEDFEQRLAMGDTVQVDVVFDDTVTRAQGPARATLTLLRGFNRELGGQRLIARGVSPQLLTPVQLEEVSLAASKARGAQLLFMIPWLALAGALIGALSVAIDVTAGERERGSLEPLLMNPVNAGALVLGKWAVVATCSASVVVLTLGGFLAAMQFVQSETLAALMQFGWNESGLFLVMLLPFAGLIAATLMLASVYGRSHKEAQTYANYIALIVNVALMSTLFLPVRNAAWQLMVPGLAQQTVLMRALSGETVSAVDAVLPGLIAAALTLLALVAQARLLRQERIVFSR